MKAKAWIVATAFAAAPLILSGCGGAPNGADNRGVATSSTTTAGSASASASASAQTSGSGSGSGSTSTPTSTSASASASASASTSASASVSALASEPPAGVPAGTDPIPLPVKGQAYDNPQPRDQVADGGTLTLPIAELGPNFNQFSASGNNRFVLQIMTWLAPRLWDYTVTGQVRPNKPYLLAAELVDTDPETIKYTLNPKAKWNDGTPIDWTAFAATWKTESGTDPRFNPASTVGYSSIANVKKGDRDNEVIVTFAKPFYPFQAIFDRLEHPRNQDPDFYKTGWINNLHPELLAGPFTVESLDDTRLVLKRNPRWWGPPGKLDRVVFRQMEDSASINAFRNEEIDAVRVATVDRQKLISDMQNVQIRRGFSVATTVYTMGQDSDLFKDEAARKAFVLGTNRKILVKIRYQGMNWKEEPPGSALMFPWQDGYRNNLADLSYNPGEARKILDGAGWLMGPDGYRHKNGKLAQFIYVTFGDDPNVGALARAQQKMARDIGLKMRIDTRRNADYSRTISKRDFDVLSMAWTVSDPFGYVWVCTLYCSDSQSNYSGLGNPDLDAQLRRVTTIPAREQAIAVANAAESEALHLFGTFPLWNGPQDIAVKRGLANYGPAGFKMIDPEDVGWQQLGARERPSRTTASIGKE